MLKITWFGHSCFILESDGFQILLDPFQGVAGLPDTEAEVDAAYCSHNHFDHAYMAHVHLRSGKRNPFAILEVPAFHDDQGGRLRGENMIRRFTAGGVSVVHLGDLGHQLDKRQLAALRGCDAVLLPVGGTYTIDAKGAKAVADSLEARVVIPMHYRGAHWGLEALQPLQAFTSLYPENRICTYPGNTLNLTADTPRQVAVLTLRV